MGTRRRTALAVTASIVGTCFLGSIALASGGGARFNTDLEGGQEVPVAADPDASGRARVNFEAGEVCFSLRYRDVGTPNRGHIHEAAAGANGPIVVPFFDLQNAADNRDPRHEDLEDGTFEACVPADQALLNRIAANPENFYVNLHNARFPGGAMRGQLDD
jgi:hypothetical protein